MTSGDYGPYGPYGGAPDQPGGYPAAPGWGQQPGGYPPAPGWGQQPGSYPPAPHWGAQPGGYPPPPQPGGYPPPPGWVRYPQPPGWGRLPGDLGIRFVARLLDGILILIVWVLFALVVHNLMLLSVICGILTFGYFVVFEVTVGATPAKKLLGLRVLGPHGALKPDVAQSMIRNSFNLLSVLPILGPLLLQPAVCIAIAVTIENKQTKQGIHDEMAGGTQVIKT